MNSPLIKGGQGVVKMGINAIVVAIGSGRSGTTPFVPLF